MVSLHPQLKKVTDRVIERSKPTRAAYLTRIASAHGQFRRAARCARTSHMASPASKAREVCDQVGARAEYRHHPVV